MIARIIDVPIHFQIRIRPIRDQVVIFARLNATYQFDFLKFISLFTLGFGFKVFDFAALIVIWTRIEVFVDIGLHRLFFGFEFFHF